jgi:hypothetical protein
MYITFAIVTLLALFRALCAATVVMLTDVISKSLQLKSLVQTGNDKWTSETKQNQRL